MKKNYTLLFCLLLIFLNKQSTAQDAYLKLGTGINLSAYSQNLFTNNSYQTSDSLYGSSEAGTVQGISGTMGKGHNFGFTFGYNFNKSVSLELGINYQEGGEYQSKYDWKRTYYGGGYYKTSGRNIFSSSATTFSPSIIFTPKSMRFSPYLRAGLIFALCDMKILKIFSEESVYGTYNINATEEFAGTLSFGSQSALGVTYSVSQYISLSGEVSMTSLDCSFESSEHTRFVLNGKDITTTLYTDVRQTVYEKGYTFANPHTDRSKPRKALLISTPFSNYAFNISLIIKLPKGSVKKTE